MNCQKFGSTVSVASGLDEITINVQTLVKNLDKTLAIMEERLLKPKFTQEAFDRIKKQTLEGFRTRNAQPANVATNVFAKISQGSTSILGISQFGTEQTVANITLADVEDYYRRFITSRGTRLVVVGDVSQKDIVGRLGFPASCPFETLSCRPSSQLRQWIRPASISSTSLKPRKRSFAWVCHRA